MERVLSANGRVSYIFSNEEKSQLQYVLDDKCEYLEKKVEKLRRRAEKRPHMAADERILWMEYDLEMMREIIDGFED